MEVGMQTTRVRKPRWTLNEEARKLVNEILDSGVLNVFYGGPMADKFEANFAAKFHRQFAFACNSGTSALHLAYSALSLERGAEVLLPANCYVSAVSAGLQCELMPVFVDIDPVTWAMDLNDLRAKITPRTAAVVSVPMYGQPLDMDELQQIVCGHELTLIEDGAAAHGTLWKGRPIGSFGVVACFSCCCTKIISCGEGGAVVTDDPRIAETVRSLAWRGKGRGFFDYRMAGYAYAMSELLAAVAYGTLLDMDDEIALRTENAALLRKGLDALGITVQTPIEGGRHGLFKLPVLMPDRWAMSVSEASDRLREAGVPVTPAHPYLLDIEWLRERRHRAFELHDAPGQRYDYDSCPTAAKVMRRQLTVDVGPGLDTDDMAGITQAFLALDADAAA
jgi:perosamine synthetase